jgi:aminoglycoside N3'-acetyltransferase
MKALGRTELIDGLSACGVVSGDIVHVQSDLRRIGPVDAPLTSQGVCDFYLNALREILGPTGTLTVCTAFEDYGRYGTPFVREESPSRLGIFSEHVRRQPGAIRSIHPIMSVTAIGARADELCGGSHYEGFGWNSPWGRLHRANAKILTLGMGRNGGGTTFFHYVEHLYGVPYQYTKIYTTEVLAQGRKIPGPFTMSVRYLDFGIENSPVRVKSCMVDLGEATEVMIGRAPTWCASAQTIVNRMMTMFDGDRWMMLVTPPRFRQGELPMDGPTGALQQSYDKAIEGKVANSTRISN